LADKYYSGYLMFSAIFGNFMGHSPKWYKAIVVLFLAINPILLATAGSFIAGWALVMEFIFTLAMALSCYPLLPGGLLALEAVTMGMATPENVFEEMVVNFPVILLLMFMVASIYFMRDLLLYIFSNLLVRVHSKIWLSFMFCFAGGFLSAFLDALTVTAVVITAATGFYSVYTKFASGMIEKLRDSQPEKEAFENQYHLDLENFRGFLRNIMMHAAVGTALGGVCTLVGEPQNLLIGAKMHWHFGEFFWRMTPITIPTLVAGLLTCLLVEKLKILGYGYQLPEGVREVLREYAETENDKQDAGSRAKLIVQALGGVFLIFALAFHIAEVGLIGLAVIILLTSLNGINDEHSIGRAFSEALPFTCLLTVFFSIVAVIHHQGLFAPIVHWTLAKQGSAQLEAFFLASGILSAVSDNVFVATIYITEAFQAHEEGLLTRGQLELVAVAINTGTNIPSVATPNGQAAFLFLLTSALSQFIRLSYVRMLILALPYTVVMSLTAYLSLRFFL